MALPSTTRPWSDFEGWARDPADVSAESSRAKDSARGVATLRLLGSRHDAVANPDHLAGAFVGHTNRALLSLRPVAHLARAWVRLRFPGAIEYQAARTKHIDALLDGTLEDGVNQLVILGAGYDSRPYRFAERLTSVGVFEVDHPATLERRIRCAREAWPSASTATRVAIDFEREDLAARLADAGYDPGRRTLFLWEGVTMFLGAAAVDRTLAQVACAAPSSSVVFDYVVRPALERPGDYYGGAQAARYFERTGEPWRFGIDADAVGAFLSARGLRLRSHYGPGDLEDAYLRYPDGRLIGRVPTFHGVVHAVVSAP
jgi:methyltransferase (TIGR00027 family)